MPASPDAIAAAVLAVFDTLPSKRKPTVRGNGVVEWVPISGVVAECKKNSPTCNFPLSLYSFFRRCFANPKTLNST